MKLSEEILKACLKIHKTLGPGLLESVYQDCIIYELQKRDIICAKEVVLPVEYEDIKFESGFRADIIVDNKIIIEVKSLEKMGSVHKAQILTYLKLTQFPLGLLINFGAPRLMDGYHRFANGLQANDL